MDRKPGKRRLTWFGNNRSSASNAPNTPNTPDTLGRMWPREPRGRGETDSWLVREPESPDKPTPPQTGWDPLPKLPAWPPLPGENQFATKKASDDIYDSLGGNSSTDKHAAPPQGQPDSRQSRPHSAKLRALWWKVTTTLRRPRVALAAVAGVLALCSVLGVAALGNSFLHSKPNSAQSTLGAGSTNSVMASPSAGQATPSASTTTTAAPGKTQPPTPLTIAFTCASGVAGGTGQLCTHTLPYAALSLSVRYCDGSYAKGKAFHGVSYADSSGNYTWRWNVTTTCVGVATATVTAKSGGQIVTKSMTFSITQ